MPKIAIHPGEHLQEELDALEISAGEFARRIDVPVSDLTQLVRGEAELTADMAMRLVGSSETAGILAFQPPP